MEEILNLLRENNEMLKDILSLLKYMNSTEYHQNDHMNQFYLNVAADLFVEMMNENKAFRDKIINNFKI